MVTTNDRCVWGHFDSASVQGWISQRWGASSASPSGLCQPVHPRQFAARLPSRLALGWRQPHRPLVRALFEGLQRYAPHTHSQPQFRSIASSPHFFLPIPCRKFELPNRIIGRACWESNCHIPCPRSAALPLHPLKGRLH